MGKNNANRPPGFGEVFLSSSTRPMSFVKIETRKMTPGGPRAADPFRRARRAPRATKLGKHPPRDPWGLGETWGFGMARSEWA